MTREQIELEVRSIGRMCRGPRDPNATRVVTTKLLRSRHVHAAAAAGVLATLPGTPTTDALLAALFAQDLKAVAAAVDEAARQRCGYDINALILDHALDGEPKEAPCPACGTVLHWTPARYEG